MNRTIKGKIERKNNFLKVFVNKFLQEPFSTYSFVACCLKTSPNALATIPLGALITLCDNENKPTKLLPKKKIGLII